MTPPPAATGAVAATVGPPAVASPLVEVERAVQERAKDMSLEMSTPGAEDQLRALIDAEVERWNDDFRRGRRAFELADPATVAERAFRNMARYGPLTELLADDDVWEIMINGPASVFVKRHRGDSGYHHEVFHDDEHVVRTLTKLLDDASSSHRKLDPAEGLQDAQLDDGARVHIVHGDVARGGHVLVNIRRFTGIAFSSLDELVEREMLTPQVAAFLRACVRARLSIVFAGRPGAGKTTLLSCTAAELDPGLRAVVAEEVFETDVPLPNVAQMQTRPARGDRAPVDLRRLVAGFLRMAPDVAIVGEVRDREALPLLLTLSSGVTGYTTIHAGSARQALTRLRFICQLADTSGGLPLAALNTLVSESIDVVVQCSRTPAGPRVTEVVAVEDLVGGAEATQFTVTELFRRVGPDGPLAWTSEVPERAARGLADAGYDVRSLLATSPPPLPPPSSASAPVSSPMSSGGSASWGRDDDGRAYGDWSSGDAGSVSSPRAEATDVGGAERAAGPADRLSSEPRRWRLDADPPDATAAAAPGEPPLWPARPASPDREEPSSRVGDQDEGRSPRPTEGAAERVARAGAGGDRHGPLPPAPDGRPQQTTPGERRRAGDFAGLRRTPPPVEGHLAAPDDDTGRTRP